MVREIAEGYCLVTERTFVRFSPPDLDRVRFECERYVRELRGDQPSLDDAPAIRLRHRRIQRLNGAVSILNAYRLKARR